MSKKQKTERYIRVLRNLSIALTASTLTVFYYNMKLLYKDTYSCSADLITCIKELSVESLTYTQYVDIFIVIVLTLVTIAFYVAIILKEYFSKIRTRRNRQR